MKQWVLSALLISSIAFGQENQFKKTVDKLNEQLSLYESLSPFGDYSYAPNDLQLSESDLSTYFEDSQAITDSIDNFTAISIIQDKIYAYLTKVMSFKEAFSSNLKTLIKEPIVVISSDDKFLYNFTLDEKTGGSYQSRKSYVFFLHDGVFHHYDIQSSPNASSEPILYTDGYSEIKTLRSGDRISYLLFGNVKGCGSCYFEYVTLLHFERGQMHKDFEFAVESRQWESKFFYDATLKRLFVKYTTDDLTPYCLCTKDALNDTEQSPNSSPIGETPRKSCSCVFEFNGKTFDLIEEDSEKAIKKD